MRTDSDLFTDVIAIINQALVDLDETTWTIKRSGQPILTIDKITTPLITIDMISAPRYGWQHQQHIINEDAMQCKELFYQDFNFQVTAFKSLKMTGTTAAGIIIKLASWLNAEIGCAFIRKLGYGIERITEIRTGFFVNETDVFEKNPNFDFRLNCLQEIMFDEESVIQALAKVERI